MNAKKSWMFQLAPAPYIVRAAEKDEFYKRHVAEQLEEICTRVLGTRWVNRFEQELRLVAFCGYYILTAQGGGQTFGEEYCDLMQIHSTRFMPQGAVLRTMQVILHLFVPYLFEKWLPRMLTRIQNFQRNIHATQLTIKSSIRELLRFHLALFFIFGAYYQLSYRVTRSKMLLMNRPQEQLMYVRCCYFTFFFFFLLSAFRLAY